MSVPEAETQVEEQKPEAPDQSGFYLSVTKSPDKGLHNTDAGASKHRIQVSRRYEDLSTVILTLLPRRDVDVEVVMSWFACRPDPNHKVFRAWVWGAHIDDAYSNFIEMVLNPKPGDPDLSKYKYLLTMEADNIPPPDGLMKLYSSINGGVDGVRYDAVGGLYWQKSENGLPLIFGNPENVEDAACQVPKDETVQECNAMGMGFTLYRMDMFRDERLERPLFQTINTFDGTTGTNIITGQDCFFFFNARKLGYRFAVDTRVRVGHMDLSHPDRKIY